MSVCTLCPRRCGVDRKVKTGFCGMGESPRVARAALHFWEEPCISGTRGSGTVFFSGCTLRCAFCQNYEISHLGQGKEITVQRLADIFKMLEDQGAHRGDGKLKAHGQADAQMPPEDFLRQMPVLPLDVQGRHLLADVEY